MKTFLLSLAVLLTFLTPVSATSAPPNIVYILADDMGYGDVQAYNPEHGKIETPHMDRLAAQGMIFTDAHTSSSVCTPTRYSILTGRYNWRTTRQSGVLHGYSPPMIPVDRLTVAGYLQQHGYTTACIGKWHLGMTMASSDGEPFQRHSTRNVDWSKPIEEGPTAIGFDYFYGISASLDMPPYIYIENDRFVGEATATKAFKRKGASHPDFEAVDVLPEIGNKTAEFIHQQDGSKPFFVYVPFTSPHTPIVPSPEWVGRSSVGAYGDFQMQTDAVIGQIVKAVDAAGLADNTLIIVTSDNGFSKWAGIKKILATGHLPSAHLRGSKSDLWEGGHRVPFIVRWPAEVAAGTSSDALICQTDLMATCAEILGQALPESAGEDSVSFMPALKGQPIPAERAGVVHHSLSGHFAYRSGKWKLLLARGSGGWTSPTEDEVPADAPRGQLYDLEQDPGETQNLFEARPDVVAELLELFETDIQRGRSNAGPDQDNDLPAAQIKLWKSDED